MDMAKEVKEAEPGAEKEEEIIEKKPMAPTAAVLIILTTAFLGLAIYLAGDELSYYFKTKDYEKDIMADYYYDQFERRDKRPERVEEPEGGELPGPEGEFGPGGPLGPG